TLGRPSPTLPRRQFNFCRPPAACAPQPSVRYAQTGLRDRSVCPSQCSSVRPERGGRRRPGRRPRPGAALGSASVPAQPSRQRRPRPLVPAPPSPPPPTTSRSVRPNGTPGPVRLSVTVLVGASRTVGPETARAVTREDIDSGVWQG